MIVVEERGYGEVSQTTGTNQPTLPITSLLNDLIKYGVTRYKFELAMKMAKPACQKDPKNCGYYIRQAFKSLGLDVPENVALQLGRQQTQGQLPAPTQLPPAYYNQQTDKSLSNSMLLLGAAVIGGVALAYFLTNRE